MSKKSRLLILAGLALSAVPVASFAFVSVGVSINIAPPELPVYEQPPCPAVGYIWTPGYWAWGDGDYYWVPGTWVAAPAPGLLWTPGFWGWSSGIYLWHGGYWGPHVGFYGGVNYGFGYGGVGFEGGYWRGGQYFYNRSVSNLGGIHVTNVYNKTVINNVTVNRVSFNGGTGGIQAHANPGELRAEHERHVDFTSAQREHEHLAATNHDLRASVNGGKPRIAATTRPAVFTGHGVVGARAAGGPIHGTAESPHGAGASRDLHANRSDRPPGTTGGVNHAGAAGGFGRGPSPHVADHGAAGAGAGRDFQANRSDRPPGATGGVNHAGAAGGFVRGPSPHVADHGATGAGGFGHGAPAHVTPGTPHVADNHFNRGPGAPGGGAGSGMTQPQNHFSQPQQHFSQPPIHMSQVNQPRGQTHFEGAPAGHPGGGGAPRPQYMPRPQSAPQPQRGGEPHGQAHGGGQPPGGGRDPQNHGRR